MTQLIQGIDPGEKRGFALTDPTDLRPRAFGMSLGRVLRVSRAPCAFGDTWLDYASIPRMAHGVRHVVEGQWFKIGGAGGASVATLAFRAGFLLCAVGGGQRLPVDVWKNALFRGGGQMSKRVFANRLARLVLPDEETLIPKAPPYRGRATDPGIGTLRFDPDCIEALGISWAASLVTGRECTLENLLEGKE